MQTRVQHVRGMLQQDRDLLPFLRLAALKSVAIAQDDEDEDQYQCQPRRDCNDVPGDSRQPSQ